MRLGLTALMLLILLLRPPRAWGLNPHDVAVISMRSFPAPVYMTDGKDHFCTWDNHRQYCAQHGYQCFVVVDYHGPKVTPQSSSWHVLYAEDSFGIGPHWFKVYLLRLALPKFAAVILVDADVMFRNLSLPLGDLIEAAEVRGRWFILGDVYDYTSHTVILRNTPRSLAYVERLWALRHVCPACPHGEQCALHVLLHELLVEGATRQGRNQLWVRNDDGQPCCRPAQHCTYPYGLLNASNPPSDPARPPSTLRAQGCTWNWWTALGPDEVRRTHPDLHIGRFGRKLNSIHPIKTQEMCVERNPSYDTVRAPDPGRQRTQQFAANMAALPDFITPGHNHSRARRLPRQVAEVLLGPDTPAHHPHTHWRLCQIVRMLPSSIA